LDVTGCVRTKALKYALQLSIGVGRLEFEPEEVVGINLKLDLAWLFF
jgi:hypothetical protein